MKVRVSAIWRSDEGVLGFQDYFVRRQCRPRVLGIDYAGGAPSAAFDAALGALGISAIIICPSNPVLSVGPILALRGIRSRLCARTVPVVAVSPIVGGKAVKGPAAANMRDLGFPVSAAGIAKWYGDLIDGLVIDTGDASEAAEIGVPVLHTDIVMRTGADRVRLARETLAFAAGLGRRS